MQNLMVRQPNMLTKRELVVRPIRQAFTSLCRGRDSSSTCPVLAVVTDHAEITWFGWSTQWSTCWRWCLGTSGNWGLVSHESSMFLFLPWAHMQNTILTCRWLIITDSHVLTGGFFPWLGNLQIGSPAQCPVLPHLRHLERAFSSAKCLARSCTLSCVLKMCFPLPFPLSLPLKPLVFPLWVPAAM